MTRRRLLPVFLLALLVSGASFAQLQTRDTPPQGYGYGPNYIPDGTRFVVLLQDKLETNKMDSGGKRFTAKLAEDLVAPNGETIPRGNKVHGHVSEVTHGFRGSMVISFDEIQTKHGWMPLAATVVGIPNEHGMSTVGEEGEIKKTTDKRKIMETAAGGAAIGAAAGAAKAGGHGAAIGAGAGAAAGTGAALLLDRNLKLDKKTQLEIRLDRPLQVPSH